MSSIASCCSESRNSKLVGAYLLVVKKGTLQSTSYVILVFPSFHKKCSTLLPVKPGLRKLGSDSADPVIYLLTWSWPVVKI